MSTVSLSAAPAAAFHAKGDPADPPVVLVYGFGVSAADCDLMATGLAAVGRYAIIVELGESVRAGPPGVDAGADKLRTMLRGLSARPVVVAASLGGVAAILALGEKSHAIAAGLVLVDVGPWLEHDDARPLAERVRGAAANLQTPTLIVEPRPASPADAAAALAFREAFTQVEVTGDEDPQDLARRLSPEDRQATILEFIERCAPRAPIAYRAGEPSHLLRSALGCFATGVTIVTTREGDRPVGVTANSFTSVSLDPPLVLVSLARTASSLPTFEQAQTFAVNVLNVDQQASAAQFASRVEDRFVGVEWEASESGSPILTGSLASFECEKYAMHDGGDHRILIGRVLRARFAPPRDPLVFYRGKFRQLHLG